MELTLTQLPLRGGGAADGALCATNSTASPEAALLKRLRAHDERALTAFDAEYGGELKRLIGRLVPDAGMAQDVWQECLLRLWKAFPQYEAGRGSLAHWAWRICRNVAIDELRAPRWRDLQHMESLEVVTEIRRRAAPASFRPEHIGLLTLSERLGPHQRQVIDLLHQHDLTHAQTALRLNVPEGTVKARARAAYRVLSRLAA